MQKYIRAFMLGIQNAMEYRSNFFLTMISAIFPIFIQFFLWTSIYGGNFQVVINGYTYIQIITYTVMANIVSRLIRTGFEYEVTDDIKNGGLNKFIIKPIDYFTYRLCCFMGQKLISLVMMTFIILLVLIFLACGLGFHLTVSAVILFFLSIILAFLLNFAIFFAISTAAFWLFEIGFLFEAVRIIIIFLSGGIFPLDIFGAKAALVFNCLPFKYTISFPVELVNGRFGPAEGITGLLIQMIWIAVFTGIARILWAKGSKHFVAVGG